MDQKPPLLMRFRDPKRAAGLLEMIQSGKPEITTSISSRDWQLGDFETAFLAFEAHSVDYLARLRKGVKSGSLERRVTLSQFLPVGVSIVEWALATKAKDPAPLTEFLSQEGRFSQALWRHAEAGLYKLSPELRSALAAHRATTSGASKDITAEARRSAVLEREAIAFALEVWGGSDARKEAMHKSRPISEAAPFIKNLGSTDIREIAALEQDSATIPGFELVRKYLVGAAEFYGNGTRLTVLSANIRPLEEVLGVDLIYYNHRFKSFVLVQYKRLDSEVGGKRCYRPDNDGNFEPECGRMEACLEALKKLPLAPSGCRGFRLYSNPFYFKFCDTTNVRALDTSIAPGFYLPYAYLGRLLKSKVARGPKGGRVIHWDTGKRFLSNGRMLELIRSGWVGTTGRSTDWMEVVIPRVLKGQTSLIYAVSSPSGSGRVGFRDVLGRYARARDPLAYKVIE